MIRGVHTMFYTSDPDGTRAFLRDKLGFPFSDLGHGWLIFEMPEADMGCHPADAEKGATTGTHNISFYCDDIKKTMAELKAKGVEFSKPVEDHGYGLVTFFHVPGGFEVQLYQPRYVKNFAAKAKKPAAKKKPAKAVAKKKSTAVKRKK